MNYFKREELEDITKELLENPTRETLKKLNEKYNGIVEVATIEVAPMAEVAPLIEEPKTPVVESPSVPVDNYVEVPKVENNTNNISFEIPSFELPKLETAVVNNQNNEPISFSGNLFDEPSQPLSNLMQTTDNFNSVPNTMPITEVPVSPVPFFGPHRDTTSNPIPVGGPTNTMPNIEPSMFGQLQQNYM